MFSPISPITPPSVDARSPFVRNSHPAGYPAANTVRRRLIPPSLTTSTDVVPDDDDDADRPAASAQRTLQQLLQTGSLAKGNSDDEITSVFGLFGSLERGLSVYDLSAIFSAYHVVLEPFTALVLSLLGTDVFPAEFCLLQYLKNPDEVQQFQTAVPADEKDAPSFIDVPFISWPLQTLLFSWYYILSAQRFGWQTLFNLLTPNEGSPNFQRKSAQYSDAANCGGLISVGKGLFAMIAASEAGASASDFPASVAKGMRGAYGVGMALHLHHQAQQVADPTAPLIGALSNLLLVNIPIGVLTILVEEVNGVGMVAAARAGGSPSHRGETTDAPRRYVIPLSTVSIGKVLTSRAAVVCGHPVDLLRLEVCLQQFSDRTGTRVHKDYLPAMTPENNDFFHGPALHLEVLRIWNDVRFSVDPQSLRIPCFSPADNCVITPQRWGPAGDLSLHLARAATSSTQVVLPRACTATSNTASLILDFNVARLNLGQIIVWSAAASTSASAAKRNNPCRVRVISLPADKPVLPGMLDTPKRSGQPAVIRSTLTKCTILNELLLFSSPSTSLMESNNAKDSDGDRWVGQRSASTGFRSLDTSFVQMGLAREEVDDSGQLETRVTEHGVCFTKSLVETSLLAFPKDVLVECPTVLSLLELWECLDLTGRGYRGTPTTIRAGGGAGLLRLGK